MLLAALHKPCAPFPQLWVLRDTKHGSAAIFTSVKEVIFCRRLSVCLLAILCNNWICMKVSGKVGNGPVKKFLNFGRDLDHGSGFGYGSVSGTAKACLGRDRHCPSAYYM